VLQVEGSFAPFFANYNNRIDFPAFLFVPQCPSGLSFATPSVDLLVCQAMQALEKEFSIDTKRRYVIGLSGGGFGAWHLIGRHKGMFAAAIPVCGGGDPRLAQSMADVAIWAFHGEDDQLAPVRGSRDMIAAIKEAGGNPRYTEYPGAGHDIGRKVEETPALLDWLFAKKRE
jgi:predicted peptidase